MHGSWSIICIETLKEILNRTMQRVMSIIMYLSSSTYVAIYSKVQLIDSFKAS